MKPSNLRVTALVAAAIAILWAFACTPPTLPMPQLPKIPSAEPPKLETPEAPKLPDMPQKPSAPEGGGNCCLRRGPAVQEKCQGADRCCIGDWKEDECEVNKGDWFFSKEGCAGAC